VRTAGIVQDSRGKKSREEDVEGEGRMVGSYSHVRQFLYLRKHDGLVSSMMSKLPLLGTDHNQLPRLVVGVHPRDKFFHPWDAAVVWNGCNLRLMNDITNLTLNSWAARGYASKTRSALIQKLNLLTTPFRFRFLACDQASNFWFI
jgi:hypothetical protein